MRGAADAPPSPLPTPQVTTTVSARHLCTASLLHTERGTYVVTEVQVTAQRVRCRCDHGETLEYRLAERVRVTYLNALKVKSLSGGEWINGPHRLPIQVGVLPSADHRAALSVLFDPSGQLSGYVIHAHPEHWVELCTPPSL